MITFLERHCEAVKGGQRVRDRFGIWTGKRRFYVKLRVDPSVSGSLVHLPGSFTIGPNRGFLYYPGQPAYCRRCGGEGHVKADCEGQRCRFCGAADTLLRPAQPQNFVVSVGSRITFNTLAYDLLLDEQAR